MDYNTTVLANRTLTTTALNLGRTLSTGGSTTIATGSVATVDGDNYATRINYANGGSVSNSDVTVTYTGTAGVFNGASQNIAANVAFSGLGVHSGALDLAGSGTLLSNGESFGTSLNAVTLAYDTTVVTGRAVTAPVTTDLGRHLTGSSINVPSNVIGSTWGAGGTGVHSNTEDATVGGDTSTINGVTLSTGPTSLTMADTFTRTFGGVINGAGITTGNFTLAVTPELSAASSISVGYTANPVVARAVTAPATTDLGRHLTGTSISVSSSAIGSTWDVGGSGAHIDTEDATLTYNGSADANGITLDTGNTTLNTATGTRAFNGTLNGVGPLTGSFTVAVAREFSGAGPDISVGYTASAVVARAVTAPATTDLGRHLTGSAINVASNAIGSTWAAGGTGKHSDTEDATLTYYGSSDANGISLYGGNEILNTPTTSRAFGGTLSGVGIVTGSFSVDVTREFSGAGSDISVGYTANPVVARAITAPTTTDLGRLMNGHVINVATNAIASTWGTGGTGAHTNTEDAAIGDDTSTINGVTLSTGPTVLTTGDTFTRTLGGAISGSGVTTGSYTLAVTPEFSTASTISVGYTANVLSQRVVSAATVSLGVQHVLADLSGSTFNADLNTTTGDDAAKTRVYVGTDFVHAFDGSAGMGSGQTRSFNGPASVSANSGTLGQLAVTTAEAVSVGDTTPYAEITVNYTAQVFNGHGAWSGGTSGDWSTHTNWQDSSTNGNPGAPGTFAGFAAVDTASVSTAATINVNTNVNLNSLTLSGPGATITGPNTLTLQAIAGPATLVASGTGVHALAAPVATGSDTNITVDPAAMLALGTLTNDGHLLQITGALSAAIVQGAALDAAHYTGTTAVAASGSLTATTIRQDTLALGANAKVTLKESGGTLIDGWPSGADNAVSIIKTLNFDSTAKLDVTNNDLILTGVSLADVENMIRNGYDGGAWDGNGTTYGVANIYSSDAAARNIFTLLALPGSAFPSGFDGVTAIPADAVIVKFTHESDLNGDGIVTGTGAGSDLSLFASYYAAYNVDNGTSTQRAVTHAQGDMDFDGQLTFNDAQLFALYYNEGLTHLPEPTSLAFLALGAAGLLARKRR